MKKVHLTLKIGENLVRMIDEMVEKGYYKSRSEFVRMAIIEKIRREAQIFKMLEGEPEASGEAV